MANVSKERSGYLQKPSAQNLYIIKKGMVLPTWCTSARKPAGPLCEDRS